MNAKATAIEPDPSAIDDDGPTDMQLLTRFIDQRDQSAFETLLLTHGPMVFGVSLRILKRVQDAEDVFQATFLSLARNAARIGRRELVANWLYTAARRAAIGLKKSASKRRQVELQREQQMSTASASDRNHDELWSDVAPVLDREIGRLADDLQAVVILCDVEGKTRKEAARQLDCPEATVSTRLMKARSLLAQRLKRQGVVLSAATLGVLLGQNAASAVLPASLVTTTLQTAGLTSAGQAVSAGMTSPQVVTLAKGTMNSLLFVNLKTAVAALVVLATAGVALQIQQEKQPAKPNAIGVANDPEQEQKVELPSAIRIALEENAAQLSPITISYSEQLHSSRTEEETFELMKISKLRSPPVSFRSEMHRVIWQAPKFYVFGNRITEKATKDNGYVQYPEERELCFDGSTMCQGIRWKKSTRTDASLMKWRQSSSGSFASSYFNEAFTGISFAPSSVDRQPWLDAESYILLSRHRGVELISVSDSFIEGQPHVRVELQVENMTKTLADQMDMEKAKQMYGASEYTPDERQQYLDNIMMYRTLPKMMRIVFFLDPARNFATRQKEKWFDPQTLVSRSRCSDFEQLPNRQLWLPRKIEIDYGMYHTAPGVFFAEPFLTNVIQVTELSGEPAPDSQFVLDYKDPHTNVMEPLEMDSVTKNTDGEPLNVSYLVGHTPAETQKNREDAIRRTLDQQSGKQPAGTTAGAGTLKPKSAMRWVVLVNVATLLSIGGFFVYRRFFRSK